MNNISDLFQCIFFGEFGLLTMTPRYLFGVLFPVMVFLGFLGQILPKIPMLRQTSPMVNQFFYGLVGLGCTTAALASLDPLTDKKSRSRMAWLLVLLIPCSAKLTIIAAFASMVTLRVFLVFLLFFACISALLYFAVGKVFPLTDALIKPESSGGKLSPLQVVKDAFTSVCETALPFCGGSILISLAVYLGLWDGLSRVFGPFLQSFMGLPKESAGLLLLGVWKRDFAAASLLHAAGSGAFDAAQLLVLTLMMCFSVPCFNSAVLLIKQQRLPGALVIWLGSLIVSLLVGKLSAEILFVCLF